MESCSAERGRVVPAEIERESETGAVDASWTGGAELVRLAELLLRVRQKAVSPLVLVTGGVTTGSLDTQGVKNRKQARSRYGAKKEKS